MKKSHVCLALAIGMATTSQGLFAAEKTEAGAAEQCIPINLIRRTEVIDDQNIKFYLRNGKTYNNHLPNSCPGLSFYKAFKYATSQSQLCKVDIISVIDSSTARPMGGRCGLGMFVPVPPKQEKQEKHTD